MENNNKNHTQLISEKCIRKTTNIGKKKNVHIFF